MHRIYKKEYNVILRSFISRALVATIVVSSLFACGGVSKEELEAIESQAKSAENEAKAAKEETEKVKKELGDKITALEGRSPADIDAAQYKNIRVAVGLNPDGTANDTAGLSQVVKEQTAFKTAIQASVGLDAAGNVNYSANGSLAKTVTELDTFMKAIKGSIGLADNGTTNGSSGLSQTIAQLRSFMIEIRKSVGLGNDGKLLDKTINGNLAENVAALPNKIVKAVNAFADKIGQVKNKININEL